MPRYAKKGSTREDIIEVMIKELQSEKMRQYVDGRDIDYEDEDDVIHNYIHNVVGYSNSIANKDVSKIDFDFENSDTAFGFLGTLPDYTTLIWCMAGGDWEAPVYFCLYLDPDNHIRAYVPKDGNTYCHKCKSAWGTCDCNEGKDSEDHLNDDDYGPDYDAMYKDVCNRIQTKE
jgi:hypothetical protein